VTAFRTAVTASRTSVMSSRSQAVHLCSASRIPKRDGGQANRHRRQHGESTCRTTRSPRGERQAQIVAKPVNPSRHEATQARHCTSKGNTGTASYGGVFLSTKSLARLNHLSSRLGEPEQRDLASGPRVAAYKPCSVHKVAESDGRNGPTAADKIRGNPTHTAQSRATHRKAKPNTKPTHGAQSRSSSFRPRARVARASQSGPTCRAHTCTTLVAQCLASSDSVNTCC
jgi:hypothetical protein